MVLFVVNVMVGQDLSWEGMHLFGWYLAVMLHMDSAAVAAAAAG